MTDLIRFPLRRRDWVEYQHALVDAAKAIDKAQVAHRKLFMEDNQQLLDAALRISVEFEKSQGPR